MVFPLSRSLIKCGRWFSSVGWAHFYANPKTLATAHTHTHTELRHCVCKTSFSAAKEEAFSVCVSHSSEEGGGGSPCFSSFRYTHRMLLKLAYSEKKPRRKEKKFHLAINPQENKLKHKIYISAATASF